MKKKMGKAISMLLLFGIAAGMVGCNQNAKPQEEAGESIPAAEAGMTDNPMGDSETFKPSDYTLAAKDEYVYEFMGLKFKLPEKIKKDMGDKKIAMLDDQSPLDQDLKYAVLTFDMMTEEQKNASVDKMGEGYAEWKNGLERVGTLGMFHKDLTEKEISEFTKCDTHEKIGVSKDGEYVYYLSTQKDDKSSFAEEFKKTETEIIEKLPRPENGFVLSEKSDLEGTEAFDPNAGKDLSNLVTTDIEGKEFTAKEFAKYDLTMVNVFATWCTACVKEIPDLVELQKEMKDKGVNIVGVVTDTVDDDGDNKEAIEKAKVIYEKTKSTYAYLKPDKTNFNGRLNGIQALPETFFVDKNGNIVGDTYSGSHDFKSWKQIVEKELENLKK